MRYVDITLCRAKVFPFIHAYLSETEAAPNYEEEVLGMGQLEKVLTLVRQDEYYPRFADKAAYFLCGLAGAQYFSNGNKRLSDRNRWGVPDFASLKERVTEMFAYLYRAP